MGIKQIFQTGAVLVVVVLIAWGISSLMNKNNATESATGSTVIDGDAQVVTLTSNGLQYELDPSTVKAGVPVQIVGDLDTLYGCSKSVRIPALGIQKYLKDGDNSIEFTPEETGTYTITCSMGMYRGSLVVE